MVLATVSIIAADTRGAIQRVGPGSEHKHEEAGPTHTGEVRDGQREAESELEP
jgi:hypothetical protein